MRALLTQTGSGSGRSQKQYRMRCLLLSIRPSVGWKFPCSAGPWLCLPCGERGVGATVEFRLRQRPRVSIRCPGVVLGWAARLCAATAMPSMPQQVHAFSASLELLVHKVHTLEARMEYTLEKVDGLYRVELPAALLCLELSDAPIMPSCVSLSPSCEEVVESTGCDGASCGEANCDSPFRSSGHHFIESESPEPLSLFKDGDVAGGNASDEANPPYTAPVASCDRGCVEDMCSPLSPSAPTTTTTTKPGSMGSDDANVVGLARGSLEEHMPLELTRQLFVATASPLVFELIDDDSLQLSSPSEDSSGDEEGAGALDGARDGAPMELTMELAAPARCLQDHPEASERLEALLDRLRVQVPSGVDSTREGAISRFAQVHGDFDGHLDSLEELLTKLENRPAVRAMRARAARTAPHDLA